MAREYLVRREEITRPPIHPGMILSEDVLPALRMSVSEAARHLRVTRQTLHRIISGRTAVTPEMAVRLGKFLWQRTGAVAANAGAVRPLAGPTEAKGRDRKNSHRGSSVADTRPRPGMSWRTSHARRRQSIGLVPGCDLLASRPARFA
jgi:addiction module HigA family antidote